MSEVDPAITIFYQMSFRMSYKKRKLKEKDKKFQVWDKFKVFFYKLPVEYKNNIENE